MDDIKTRIAINLRKYRDLKKLTQKDLANLLSERLGIQLKHNAVSAWESGTNSIDISILLEICNILGVSINDMYGLPANKKDMLSIDENNLVATYRQLSLTGKSDVRNFAEYTLTKEQQPDNKENKEIHLIAAHNDNLDDPEEQEKVRRDLDKF